MIPVNSYDAVPLDREEVHCLVDTINGEECVFSPTGDGIFYGSKEQFDQVCAVLDGLAKRAIRHGFHRSQVAVPVKYPNGTVALLVATFNLGKPIEMGIR